MPGTSFSWSIIQGAAFGASGGIGNPISQILTLPLGTLHYDSVIYSITPTGPLPTFCLGNATNFKMFIEPTVTISAPNDTICNGTPTNIVVSSSNVTTNGIKYTWTVIAPGSVSGASANLSGQAIGNPIVQTLANSSANTQEVIYHIIPYTLNGSGSLNCTGTPIDVDVWVEPTVTISAPNDTICNGTPTNIVVSSSNVTTNGIKYTWTVIAPGSVSGASANLSGQAIGNPIVQTLANSSANTQEVIYHIIPYTLNGSGSLNCTGTSIDVDVWVEPTVTISAPNDTICNGTPTNIVVSSSNVTTNGIKYTWTVIAPGSVSGASANLSGQAIGNPIVQTLANSSANTQEVIYHIIPYTLNGSGSLNCTGTSIDVDVWVEPTVTISAPNDTICNGTSTDILVSSSNVTTNGIKYTWTVTAPGSVSGASANSSGQAVGTPIIQTLTNSSASKQEVIYHITPRTLNGSGSLNCTGTSIDVDVWVEPTVTISAPNDTICNGTSTDILVSSSNVTTNGIKYTWTVTAPGSVSGASANSSGQAVGTPIIQTLTNSSASKQEVIYHITPRTLNGSGSLNCTGTSIDVDVWVEPTVTISAPNDTICNGTPTNIVVSSSNVTTNGIKYTWTVIAPGSVSGASANLSGQAIGNPIVQTLANSSANTQEVIYHIIPYTLNGSGSLNCTGTSIDVDVWVEPTVTISAPNDTICNGTPTNIVVSSSNVTTNGIKYTWTVIAPGSVSGASANLSGQAIGNPIVQTLANSSANTQEVIYHIIPYTLNGSGSLNCTGTSIDVDVWVEPTVTISAPNDTICNGTSTDILVSSSNVTTNGIKYTWTVTAPGSVSGASANSSGQAVGTPIIQTLTNSSAQARGNIPHYSTYS